MITTVLADDHTEMRMLMRAFLADETDIEILGETGETDTARALCWELKPDVLVLDVNMPDGPSLPAIGVVHERSPGTAVVMISMQDDRQTVSAALEKGALGYVLKQTADTELAEAVRSASKGVPFISPELESPLLRP